MADPGVETEHLNASPGPCNSTLKLLSHSLSLLTQGSPDCRGEKSPGLEKDEKHFKKEIPTHINRYTAFINHSEAQKITASRCTDQT